MVERGRHLEVLAPTPTPVAVCPLDGTELEDPSLAERTPILAQIENNPIARPPSGLNLADLVIEAPVEGNTTRFSAFFMCDEQVDAAVGPVRSMRYFNLDYWQQMRPLTFVFGGAGRDVLIANSGADRLIDWTGQFNTYLVPFSQFGMSTISRMVSPQIQQFLYDLSRGAGADRTRAADTGSEPARNGEPEGEIGLVNQRDVWWQDQTGAPDDGNPGDVDGPKDVLRNADFNNGSAQGFSADSGAWTVQGGALYTSATSTTGDAVAIYHVGEQLPSYYELQATLSTVKPTAGWKANAYVIFDYHSPTDFKFAGINVLLDKIELGHRNESGWVLDVQAANVKLRADTNYNVLVAVNGLVVTVTVNNSQSFSYAFEPRMIDGVASNLNWGYVGFGSVNARGKLDNVQVKVLERPFTLITTDYTSESTQVSQELKLDYVGDRVNGDGWSICPGLWLHVTGLS